MSRIASFEKKKINIRNETSAAMKETPKKKLKNERFIAFKKKKNLKNH